MDETLEELFAVIEDRKETLPEDSYTASLFTHEKGENEVLEKLGEETTELVLAAKDDDREEIAHEGADIVYHLLVLLSMKDMELSDLEAELEARRCRRNRSSLRRSHSLLRHTQSPPLAFAASILNRLGSRDTGDGTTTTRKRAF